MNLQTNRPPNLAQLHDGRFETFNREPKILSTVKKAPQVDFKKQLTKERHECLIEPSGDVGMQSYQIKDDLVKHRATKGHVQMSKHTDWS